jgi:hypothetical protein
MGKLANPGDPYVMGARKIVFNEHDPGNGTDIETYVERRVIPAFHKVIPSKTRNIDDLPEADAKQQAGYAAVVALRLMGVQPADIAEMLETNVSAVEEIMQRPAVQNTFEQLFQGVINAHASTVQGKIASFADSAVDAVVELMANQETRQDVRLKAAQDILDRSGTGPDQFFMRGNEHHTQNDELRITVFGEDEQKKQVEVSLSRKK